MAGLFCSRFCSAFLQSVSETLLAGDVHRQRDCCGHEFVMRQVSSAFFNTRRTFSSSSSLAR